MTIDARELCPLLQVFDMPRALRFYRDALGFELIDPKGAGDDVAWCLLRLGGAWLMLNTAYEAHERPARPDPARIAAHQDTGLFITVSGGLDELYAELTAKGLSPKPPATQAYGMGQLYLTDPDGYEICFQHPAETVP